MQFEKIFNPLENFDFQAVLDPSFGEEAVREEIITPILHALEYKAIGPYKIIRNKRLKHPFVSIGSKRKNITLIPDYLLMVDDKISCVIEAKNPAENIFDTKHIEQAYSYSIHPEIRSSFFALCNGKDFALYNISREKPEIEFPIIMTAKYWPDLIKLIHPSNILKNPSIELAKDLGLHLKRLGFDKFESLTFLQVLVPYIAKINHDQYTFSVTCKIDGENYMAAFDFPQSSAEQLKDKIPSQIYTELMKPFKDTIRSYQFADFNLRVNVTCHIGDKLEENENEIFLPLIATEFPNDSRFA